MTLRHPADQITRNQNPQHHDDARQEMNSAGPSTQRVDSSEEYP